MAKDLISQKNIIHGIHFFNKDITQKFKGDTEEILKWITQIQLSPTLLAKFNRQFIRQSPIRKFHSH